MTDFDFHAVESELERLSKQVLEGEITEEAEGEETVVSVDDPGNAARVAVDYTDIYDETPESVLTYVKNQDLGEIPTDFVRYEEGERGVLRAQAKGGFKEALEDIFREKYREQEDG